MSRAVYYGASRCGCDGVRCVVPIDGTSHGKPQGYNLGCRCVPCADRARRRHSVYYQFSGEDKRAHAAARRAADPEGFRVREAEAKRRQRAANPTKHKMMARAWAANNPEVIHLRNVTAYAKNAEDRRQYQREYRRTPTGLEIERANSRKRRAYEMGRACPCDTADAAQTVRAADGGLCAYCGEPGEAIDHVIPLSRGGWSCVWNYRLVCTSCNSSKHVRSLSVFLARRAARGLYIRPGATNSGLPCPEAARRMATRAICA